MGRIEKDNGGVKPETYDEILKKYEDLKGQIKYAVGKLNDPSEALNDSARSDLSNMLISERVYARRLSELSTGESAKRAWLEDADKWENKARAYGSLICSFKSGRTMADIKGLDDVKALVESFIYLNEHPSINKYYKIEGGMGLMMYGAPGTGKTMFAEAIANAMQLPLFIVTPANIFKSYVGASEAAVKQIFQNVDSCEGAVLFVDECESIFSRRTADTKDYKTSVTNELLQRMNGMTSSSDSGRMRILVAATNRPELIDPAYLRYKRFSHVVHIAPPEDDAFDAILTSKLKGIALEDITPEEVCEMARQKIADGSRYSAADLCGIVEETCRIAIGEIVKCKCENTIPLTRRMFKMTFDKHPPSITKEDMDFYNNFKKSNMIE